MLIRTAPATANGSNPWCFHVFPTWKSAGLEAEIQVEGPCLGLSAVAHQLCHMELQNIERNAMQRRDSERATLLDLLAYGTCQRSGKGSWEQSAVWHTVWMPYKLQDGAAAEPWHLGQAVTMAPA